MAASAVPWGAGGSVARAPRPYQLAAIGLAGLTAAATSLALALRSDHVAEPGLQAALIDWVIVLYIFSGLVAWWRRPENRLGPLMVAAGFVMFLSTLAWSNSPVPFTIGQVLDLVPAVIFLHLYLSFPSGRLEGSFERVLVATAYATAFGLELVRMSLGGFGPDNLLELTIEPGLANTVQDVQLLAISTFCLTGIGVLVVRRRGAGPPLRRSVALLVDSFAVALVMIAALLVSGTFGWPWFETIRRVTFVVIGLAPVAFLIGLLGARLARSAVGDLLMELQEDPAPADLRDSLARALGDPSLSVAYWLPQFGSWADAEGRAVTLPKQNGRRATTLIDRDGTHVAALLHDPALEDEPELLDAVSAAAGIALENGRLHAELRARLDELRESRARVLEAGQSERQRLERDLHDGAQQRLVALSLELGMLEERLAADPDARARVDQARREIALSLDELRALARGIHPAVVTGHGLAVALESIAARAAVPVRLTVELEDRVEERIEVAAYYVVCESLANIGKHAQATAATVEARQSGGRLVVEVRDDGVGGADTERGSGIRGLADRVEALGGRLLVWTPVGGGTRVRAEIPCE
jgi:signal transduction histidine kinase